MAYKDQYAGKRQRLKQLETSKACAADPSRNVNKQYRYLNMTPAGTNIPQDIFICEKFTRDHHQPLISALSSKPIPSQEEIEPQLAKERTKDMSKTTSLNEDDPENHDHHHK